MLVTDHHIKPQKSFYYIWATVIIIIAILLLIAGWGRLIEIVGLVVAGCKNNRVEWTSGSKEGFNRGDREGAGKGFFSRFIYFY